MDFNALIREYGPLAIVVPGSIYCLYLLVLSVTKTSAVASDSMTAMVALATGQTSALNVSQQEVINLQKEKSNWLIERDGLIRKIELLETKVKELSSELGKNDANTAELKKKLTQIEKELLDIKSDVIREQELRSEIELDRDKWRSQSEEYKARIDEMQKRIDDLELKTNVNSESGARDE